MKKMTINEKTKILNEMTQLTKEFKKPFWNQATIQEFCKLREKGEFDKKSLNSFFYEKDGDGMWRNEVIDSWFKNANIFTDYYWKLFPFSNEDFIEQKEDEIIATGWKAKGKEIENARAASQLILLMNK